MMTALLIYCYAHGVFWSRKFETASCRDVTVRYERIEELLRLLEQKVEELVEQTVQVDGSESDAGDRNELIADVETIPQQLEAPDAVLVDASYESMDQIGQIEQSGATVYCSMSQEREHHQSLYDFKPPKEHQAAVI